MEAIICWLVVHTSNGPKDDRSYKQYTCYVMDEYTNHATINCYADFKLKHINMRYNSPVQYIDKNECLYGKR